MTHVFETHIHNNYVSGGLALARQSGAAYHVNAADAVAFSRVGIGDGDTIAVGRSMRVRVITTPGHTFTHLAYALEDAATGQVTAVFTGGSLLHGSTGRPDLLGPEHTLTLAAAQYASARRLARVLPDRVPVYPTHGFGSFCAAGASSRAGSTVGEEKRSNPALTLGEDGYVTALVEGLDAYPAYYAHMAAANAAGPDAPDPAPPARVTAGELGWRISAGEWIADLRDRRAFAAGHIPGSFSFEYGDSFATYLGWLIPWGTSLTVVGETGRQIAAAQRDLARIGIDYLAAAAIASSAGWPAAPRLATYPVSDFQGLAAARDRHDLTVLDVRRASERARGHIAGSIHVPLHELSGRLRQLPRGPLWVHCQAGYRASIAASLLHAAEHTVTAVDDDFGRAAAAGLPVTGPSGRTSAAALAGAGKGAVRLGRARPGQLLTVGMWPPRCACSWAVGRGRLNLLVSIGHGERPAARPDPPDQQVHLTAQAEPEYRVQERREQRERGGHGAQPGQARRVAGQAGDREDQADALSEARRRFGLQLGRRAQPGPDQPPVQQAVG